MKSKISKEKYQSTYVNIPKNTLENLTKTTVNQFDFILTDVTAWNDLSDLERRTILNAVSREGIALMLRPNQETNHAKGLNHPIWNEPVSQTWTFRQEEIDLTSYPILSSWLSINYNGHQLAKYTQRGLGHIVMLSIDESFKLLLADGDDIYQNLWAEIFSNLYIDFNTSPQVIGQQWLWSDERNDITVSIPDVKELQPRLNDSTALSYLEIPFLDDVFELNIWPEVGYNTLAIENGHTMPLYAHSRESWRAKRQSYLSVLNQQAADASQAYLAPTITVEKSISFIWWYIMALLGFCALWIDERLYD